MCVCVGILLGLVDDGCVSIKVTISVLQMIETKDVICSFVQVVDAAHHNEEVGWVLQTLQEVMAGDVISSCWIEPLPERTVVSM